MRDWNSPEELTRDACEFLDVQYFVSDFLN